MENLTSNEIAVQLKESFGADWNKLSFENKVLYIAAGTLRQTTNKKDVLNFCDQNSYQFHYGYRSLKEVVFDDLKSLGVFDLIDPKFIDLDWYAVSWGQDFPYVYVKYEESGEEFHGYVTWLSDNV